MNDESTSDNEPEIPSVHDVKWPRKAIFSGKETQARIEQLEAELAAVTKERDEMRDKSGLWWANKQAETATERDSLRQQLAEAQAELDRTREIGILVVGDSEKVQNEQMLEIDSLARQLAEALTDKEQLIAGIDKLLPETKGCECPACNLRRLAVAIDSARKEKA